MKKTVLFFIFFSAFFSINLKAQKEFFPGYIITLEDDTIHGSINLSTNNQNSTKCIFREKGALEENLEFSPFDIKAYMIADRKYYISKEIKINDEIQKVFLEYLVDGIVDLFFFKIDGEHCYFIEKEDVMYPLTNEELKIKNEYGKTEIKRSQKYKGALTYLARDNSLFQKRAMTTQFSKKSLVNYTKEYHNTMCDEYECIVYTKKTKSEFYFESIAGVSMSNFTLKNSYGYDKYVSPVVGGNLRIIPNSSFHLINYNIGIYYSKQEYQGEFVGLLYSSAFSGIISLNLNFDILSMPLLIEYRLSSKKIQPSFFAGFTNVLVLNSEYSLINESVKQFTKRKESGQPAGNNQINSDFKKYQLGFLGGMGFRFKMNKKSYVFFKGLFERRISGSDNNNYLDDIKIKSNQIYFGYGFRI